MKKKDESIPLHVGLVPGALLSETEIYFSEVSKEEKIKRIISVAKKHLEQKFPHLWNLMKVQPLAKEYIHYQVETNQKKEVVAEFPSEGDSKIIEITCILQYAQSNQLYEFCNSGYTQKQEEEFQLLAECQDHSEFRRKAFEQFALLRERIFTEGMLNQTRQNTMQNAMETTQKKLETTQKELEITQNDLKQRDTEVKELRKRLEDLEKNFDKMIKRDKIKKEKMSQIQRLFEEYSEL